MHDPVPAVDRDLAAVAKFLPPAGHLVVAVESDGTVVGVGSVQRLTGDIAEVKRMYVDPSVRRGGVGRRILGQLIDHARRDGYRDLRLDSPGFMHAAHALYQSMGFRDVAPYAESEIPEAYRAHARFMERSLVDGGQV